MEKQSALSVQQDRHWGVFVCCLAHGLVFGAACVALTIKFGLGAAILGILALAHLGVAGLALLGKRERLCPAFVGLGRLSLIAFLVITAFSVHSAAYIAELYGGLGRGIAAVIAAMLCVVALWTVPVGLWGLSWSKRGVLGSWLLKAGGASLVGAAVMGMASGKPTQMPKAGPAPDAQALQEALAPYLARVLPATHQPGIRDPGPWTCAQIDENQGPLVVAYAVHQGKARAQCFRVAGLGELSQMLQESGLQGVYRMDWVTHRDPWRYKDKTWLSPVSLRPGIDGVCMQDKCLSAWQLVALDGYLTLKPVPSIPDLRFGVSPDTLAKWLGVKAGARATRISTTSYVVGRHGKVTKLARQRKRGSALSRKALESVKTQAQDYVLRAQRPDGGFEYMRNVFLEQKLPDHLNLPRQGGTLAALCEWGEQTPAVQHAIARALQALTSHEHRHGEWSVLWPAAWGDKSDLGSTALPLIALIKCRDRVQGRYDAVIGRLLRGLARFQRENGSFAPELRLADGEISARKGERLYASGQAVLATLSALRVLGDTKPAGWPGLERLQTQGRAAMEHYGQRYWSHFLGDFFFIEENWHCLAARESLGVLPDEMYGDFCIDYLKFKSKFTLRPYSRVDEAFLGGYGFGNLIVPQTTPSAGQAEALAAGIAVLKARGDDPGELQEELRSILGFLWRQQLGDINCRACVNPGLVRGGFTESMISPTIRIDYVQHVLSAFGAGLEVLS